MLKTSGYDLANVNEWKIMFDPYIAKKQNLEHFCVFISAIDMIMVKYIDCCCCILTHLSLASLLWDIGKQHSPRCDAAERGVPSGAILFAYRNFIKKLNKN